VGINVVWRNERGESLGEVEDPTMLLSRFSTRNASPVSGSICLRFLDPAGDACFNQRQLPFLIQELRAARDGVGDPKLAAHLNKVLALVEGANEVHTYVWFVGD
jgi:hypothetical protein